MDLSAFMRLLTDSLEVQSHELTAGVPEDLRHVVWGVHTRAFRINPAQLELIISASVRLKRNSTHTCTSTCIKLIKSHWQQTWKTFEKQKNLGIFNCTFLLYISTKLWKSFRHQWSSAVICSWQTGLLRPSVLPSIIDALVLVSVCACVCVCSNPLKGYSTNSTGVLVRCSRALVSTKDDIW